MDKQQSQNFSEDDKKLLKTISMMISEKSEGKIPKDKCDASAKRIINRKKYNDANGNNISIEKYVSDCVWSFFQ